jgi:hypothetical protein
MKVELFQVKIGKGASNPTRTRAATVGSHTRHPIALNVCFLLFEILHWFTSRLEKYALLSPQLSISSPRGRREEGISNLGHPLTKMKKRKV